MNLAYGKLLEENEKLKAEIQVLKESNQLLVEKVNARLKHPLASEEELALQYEAALAECDLYRQRFVWAMSQIEKTIDDIPKDEDLPFILRKQAE